MLLANNCLERLPPFDKLWNQSVRQWSKASTSATDANSGCSDACVARLLLFSVQAASEFHASARVAGFDHHPNRTEFVCVFLYILIVLVTIATGKYP